MPPPSPPTLAGDTPRAKLTALLGSVGFWTFQLDGQPTARAQELVRGVEALGFGAVWVPEGLGSKEAMSHAGLLLAGSSEIVVATGIASIWARDPMAMSNGARALHEAYPDRFVLGMGVSHQVRATARGHRYEHPLAKMRDYLAAMDEAAHSAATPTPAPRLLAALGPKMLDLASERAQGAHPYFVPVDHTRVARERLGPDAFLAPEQLVVLETDPAIAREIGRTFMSHYLSLPNYANNLKRFGWTEQDMTPPYPDAFVDALVAWGDVEAIAERVAAHHEAGADHVAIQVLREDASAFPLEELRVLGPTLLG